MYKIKSCFSCGKDSFYFGVNRVTEVWIKNLGQAFLKVDLNFKFLGSTFMPKSQFFKILSPKSKKLFLIFYFLSLYCHSPNVIIYS